MEDLKAFLFVFGGALVIVGALISALVFLGNLANANSCRVVAQQMEVSYRYSFWGGCLFQYNGHWIPSDAIRVVQVNHD